ncbi:MAG: adenosylmethionine--8-amino-7-oxononanoate transaminase [Verrucomicrobia bacterium GWF2_51_19]|nr:MAG: adenosylmethionine--8-amino-7-oxononanoate transaminase [Verrucomicrobia bacterium GWF2_51_19]HCJ12485.1 adenosylmethionine--8-amino-7-oxononanoate transaminase [Opitutae bacterium]
MTSLALRDKKLLWHPFTQEKKAQPPLAICRGEGSYVYDDTGKAYLDLISSWWVNLHGHAHPAIAKKIYEQALTLEHVLFAGCTHEPAVQLCERLQAILPKALTRFFFSDDGSTCVEVALKMAYQYWHNQGQRRPLFISFDGGYHGDTVGAMSVGAHSGYHDVFKDFFFKSLSLPYPDTWDGDATVEEKEQAALKALDALLEQHDKISALLVEPLVQGASGMRMCRPSFLKAVVERVRAHKILVIFDEVMTGFGRTGTTFALEQVGCVPDFLCLSKGLTGGFMPLALTVTTADVYNAFLSDSWDQAFFHGHSYTANPLACAAALASLDLLQATSTQNAIRAIHQAHKEGLALLLTGNAPIVHTRLRGTIAAFELTQPHQVRQQLIQNGLLIRPLDDTLYILPPYSTTPEELLGAYRSIQHILTQASRGTEKKLAFRVKV